MQQGLQRLDRQMVWTMTLVVFAVVLINFITSYGHIYVESILYGEYGVDARLAAPGIDGMLLALGLANVFAARVIPHLDKPHKFGRRMLRAALAFGVGGTVAANGAYGAHWGLTGGLLATWSPVALFISVESGLFMFHLAAELAQARERAEAAEVITDLKPRRASGRRKPKQDAKTPGTEVTLRQDPPEHLKDPFFDLRVQDVAA